jgi:hypothetical protein
MIRGYPFLIATRIVFYRHVGIIGIKNRGTATARITRHVNVGRIVDRQGSSVIGWISGSIKTCHPCFVATRIILDRSDVIVRIWKYAISGDIHITKIVNSKTVCNIFQIPRSIIWSRPLPNTIWIIFNCKIIIPAGIAVTVTGDIDVSKWVGPNCIAAASWLSSDPFQMSAWIIFDRCTAIFSLRKRNVNICRIVSGYFTEPSNIHIVTSLNPFQCRNFGGRDVTRGAAFRCNCFCTSKPEGREFGKLAVTSYPRRNFIWTHQSGILAIFFVQWRERFLRALREQRGHT